MSINLLRYEGATIAPKKDTRLASKVHTKDAIYSGCNITIVATNQLHITSGNGIVQGGEFEIIEQDFLVALPSNTEFGTGYGIIYIRINLSDLTTPIELKSVIYNSFTSDPIHYDLTQDADLYETSGVFEIPICLYQASTTAVTSVDQTYEKNGSIVNIHYDGDMILFNNDVFETTERNIAALHEVSSGYAEGSFVIYDGILYKKITDSGVTHFVESDWERVNVTNELKETNASVGTLESLTTTAKTSIVNAINEIITKIGSLASLTTTNKTSIVNAINNLQAIHLATVTAASGYITIPSNQVVYSVQNSSATVSNDNVTSWQRTSTTQIYYNKSGTTSTTLTVVYKP